MLRSKAGRWLFVALVTALVLWIRVLPRSLASLDETAERVVRIQLRERMEAQGSSDASRAERDRTADALVDAWVAQHRAEFDAEVAATAQRLKSPYLFLGEDGKPHVYLGDYDSYLWLRHASTLLRTGSPCDAIVNGDCRDTLTNAPVGASSIYARSLHVYAIARLHQLVTAFAPKYPLETTSFFVPVIVGCLGVLPAFFIGWRLAPSLVAGPFAALLTTLQPNVIARTIGSDNDIWNVVLPLYALWALLAAVSAQSWRGRVLMASLSAGCIALQAWAWRGWLFSYAVLGLGLVGLGLIWTARALGRRAPGPIWRRPEAARIAIVAFVFYAAAGLLTSLADPDQKYLRLPVTTIRAMLPAASPAPITGSAADFEWPSVFDSIGELRPMALQNTANAMGHTLLACGLVGLLLLFLPERWDRRHMALFVAGTAWYWVSVSAIEPGRLLAVAILAAPLGAALLLGGDANEDDTGRWLAAASLAVWFLGAVYLAYNGARYLLLLAPPLGISCAVLAGRLQVAVARLVHDTARWYRLAVNLVLAIVLVLAFVHPTTWAYRVASGALPAMDDAWWDTLVHLRQSSPPDAIVHAMADAGHWITYGAERRVSNDGSSLSTHIPFWTARVFAAPIEKESLGILRMLSCGSDAMPLPEGGRGAYGRLLAAVHDPAVAYGLLNEIVALDRNAADAHLARHGLTASARDEILQSSHCTPPDSYLIATSTMMAARQSWLSLGLQDPRQPPAIGLSRRAHVPEVLAADDRAADIAFLPRWIPCGSAGDHQNVCRAQNPIVLGASTLSAFEYDPAAPQNGRLQGRAGGTSDTRAAPAALVIAGDGEISSVEFPDSPFAGLGVLIDVPNQRILLGAPSALRSTYVRLMYLDERYSPHFLRFDERRTPNERVVAWRIDWREGESERR